jgi:hypothetical protein
VHNRYVGLSLERLDGIERGMAAKEEQPVARPARLDPRRLPLSKQDRNLISEALSRPTIVHQRKICMFLIV